jgi:hypothetical protein
MRFAAAVENNAPVQMSALWTLLALWARILGASEALESLASSRTQFRAVLGELRESINGFCLSLNAGLAMSEPTTNRLGVPFYDRALDRAARAIRALVSDMEAARDVLDRVLLAD